MAAQEQGAGNAPSGRESRALRSRASAYARVTWALLTLFLVESVIFGLAVLPGALFLEWHYRWPVTAFWARVVLLSMAFIPAYTLFAFSLMMLSAAAMKITGWRPPRRAEIPLKELSWPLLDWGRYGVAFHLVRVFAGTLFRTTPVWTLYMRANGAKLGKRVYINSLEVSDHALLEFDDDVVIGGGVHLSGHTFERGVLKTAPVRLARGVTVGAGAVVEIGVEAGPGCQIGALAFVPKYSHLDGNSVYVGIPVRKLTNAEPTTEDQNPAAAAAS